MGEESWSAARIDHVPVPVMPDTGPFTFLLRASVSSSEEGGGGTEPSPSCFQFSKFWEPPVRPAAVVSLQGGGAASGSPCRLGIDPRSSGSMPAASLPFTRGFSSFSSSPCSCLSFGKVLKSWKVGAVLPARRWAGWQPKPELGFDFIFSFSD